MPKDELIAALEKATADSAGLMLEAWEHLCRTSVGFRRYACTSVDEYGLTVTGRFCRFVDAGAYESAALTLVPEGMRRRSVVMEDGKAGVQLWWPDEDIPGAWGQAYASEPIATVIAALRALQDRKP